MQTPSLTKKLNIELAEPLYLQGNSLALFRIFQRAKEIKQSEGPRNSPFSMQPLFTLVSGNVYFTTNNIYFLSCSAQISSYEKECGYSIYYI